MADVKEFLDSIKLSKYYDALVDGGAESMEDLLGLDEDEIKELAGEAGMKVLHKKKFIKAVLAKKGDGGGGDAAPPQQQQKAPPQQYTAPAPVEEKKQAPVQPQAPAKRLTKDEQQEANFELLIMQNPELREKLQDENTMQCWQRYVADPQDPEVIEWLDTLPYFRTLVEQMTLITEKAESGEEINKNPLLKCSLKELQCENIDAFRAKMGCCQFEMGGKFSVNDDIVASNEFCQIAIGKRLFEEQEDDENAAEEEADLPIGWIKSWTPEGKAYYQNLVTKQIQWTHPNESEVKDDEEDDGVVEPQPQVVHDGVRHWIIESDGDDDGWLDYSQDQTCPPISFFPGNSNFTFSCEIMWEGVIPTQKNCIFSNGSVEFFLRGQKICVKTQQHKLQPIGNTKLQKLIFYHVSVVCERKKILIEDGKDKGKRIDATEFTLYLDGQAAGLISLNGISNFDNNGVIGRTLMEEPGYSNGNFNMFVGSVVNVKVFYNDLTADQVFVVAQNESNQSYKPTRLLAYKPETLKVMIAEPWVIYNGPIHGKLPQQCQFPNTKEAPVSISCYIMLLRANSKHGSVIISNRRISGGFELLCPMPKTGVLGMKCEGTRDYDLIPIGKTKLKLNRFYHIAVTVEKEEKETRFVSYINGKKDGSYNMDHYQELSNGDAPWCIGHRGNKKEKTKFDGTIQALRIFNYALSEAEVATVYAADIRECAFKKNQTVMYLAPDGTNDCPKCGNSCQFGEKFCTGCSAPLIEKFLLEIEEAAAGAIKGISAQVGGNAGGGNTDWGGVFAAAATGAAAMDDGGYDDGYGDGGGGYDDGYGDDGGGGYGDAYAGGDYQQEEKTYQELWKEELERYEDQQAKEEEIREKAGKHETTFQSLKWEKGVFISRDLKRGKVNILDKNNQKRQLAMNEVIMPTSELKTYIPAEDALKIENIGGEITLRDFHDNEYTIVSDVPGFVKYLITPSCLNRLTRLERFPKYEFENIINNEEVRNFYVLNRLLYAAHELLINVNDGTVLRKGKTKKQDYTRGKQLWEYFNEYILPWETIWTTRPNGECVCGEQMVKVRAQDCYAEYPSIGCDVCTKDVDGDTIVYHCPKQNTLQHSGGYDSCVPCQTQTNFQKLKEVAKTLQNKYKQQQFTLFDELRDPNMTAKASKFSHCQGQPQWKIFDIKNAQWKHKSIINRQNCFPGGIHVELEENDVWKKVPEQIKNDYDQKVVTMIIWGRCHLVNKLFQTSIENLYKPLAKRMEYCEGPIKTYERMMEKAVEYRVEDKQPFPSSMSICDVNRCSIKCSTLDDVCEAFMMLTKCGFVEIVRIKNRFLPEFYTDNGYRDMLVNCVFRDQKSGLAVIAEVQFHLHAYEHIKHKQHKYYKIDRAETFKSLFRNYEASAWKKREKRDKAQQAKQEAMLADLKNGGN